MAMSPDSDDINSDDIIMFSDKDFRSMAESLRWQLENDSKLTPVELKAKHQIVKKIETLAGLEWPDSSYSDLFKLGDGWND